MFSCYNANQVRCVAAADTSVERQLIIIQLCNRCSWGYFDVSGVSNGQSIVSTVSGCDRLRLGVLLK